MTHVKVIYQEERLDEEGYPYPEFDLFLEGNFKKIEWDGEVLTVKGKTIRTRDPRDGWGNVIDDILYLEIDGIIIIDKREEEVES